MKENGKVLDFLKGYNLEHAKRKELNKEMEKANVKITVKR